MKTSNKILAISGAFLLVAVAVTITSLAVLVFYDEDYAFFRDRQADYKNKQYEVTGFKQVALTGFWKVARLTKAANYSVTINGTRDMLTNITVQETGGKLLVKQKHFPVTFSGELRIDISAPSLEKIDIGGAGLIELFGFQEQDLSIVTTGMNEIKAAGCTADNLKLGGKGVIALNFAACAVTNAQLDLTGIGSVDLTMTGGKLTGRIDRDITVTYNGKITEKQILVNSTGEVVPAGETGN